MALQVLKSWKESYLLSLTPVTQSSRSPLLSAQRSSGARARSSGTEASKLRPFLSGRWAPCEAGPPSWGRVWEEATD